MDNKIELKNKEDLKELVLSFITSSNLQEKVGKQKVEMAVRIAVLNGLNPFKKEVYFIPFKNAEGKYDLTIVTGYEVYLKRAEASGKLEYWNVELEDANSRPVKAVITIKRKDWSKEFKHEVYYSEVAQQRGSWIKMPRFMLKKVAISQGFRLCFPDVLADLPNTIDEIPAENNEEEIVIPDEILPATQEQKNILNKLPLPDEVKQKIETLSVEEARKIIYEYTTQRNNK